MKLKKAINQFIEHSKNKGRKSPSTIKNYQRYLLRFLAFTGDIKPLEITLDHIDNFQKHLIKSGASLTTQKFYLIGIRVLLKYLRVRKDILCLDFQKIELPVTPRKILPALTDKEIKKLLQASITPPAGNSRYSWQSLRDRTILEILLGSGLRVSELVKLRTGDLDFENKQMIVQGKGNKNRVGFLTNDAIRHLRRWLKVRPTNSEYLFTTRGKDKFEPLTTRSVQRLVRELGKRAEIRMAVTPHVLRRSYGARMSRRGANLRTIQELLGHSQVTTTQLYTAITQPELQKEFKRANTNIIKNVPDGEKRNEFVVMSTDNFYKLTGMIASNRKLLLRICKELKIKTS